MIDTFTSFGDLLKFLRIRAHLTQRDLSIAVGYSEAQISRQESNKRVPSEHALKALFVPALGLDDEPETVSRLLMLAEKARGIDHACVVSIAEEDRSQPTIPHAARHNLPRQLTSYIGREKELEQVLRMVRDHPLVTLTGAGGVGKTRLALHAAARLVDDFPDGVWLVELAPVIDPVFVPIAVAAIFQVHSAPGQRLAQTLLDALAEKCLLLILDNCEHVIDAAAELSASLLKGCPNLSILATSREILNVEGEFFFRCPSLSLPDSSPAHLSTPLVQRVEASEAARLFVERAAAAAPGFHLSEKNASTIADICQHLDGIPLAIELAAARLRLLSLDQIAGSMGNLFGLLSGNRRVVQPRHKTLKAMIEWSYQLLSSAEQILLRRVSVFAGGWTLPAAGAVASGDGLEPGEVLEQMQGLLDKSLIFVESMEVGENRYLMLETIRQYATEKLLEAGEYQKTRDRHLAFFSQMAQQAAPAASRRFMTPGWAQRLMNELDNIRLALEWSVETDIEPGLQLAISFSYAVPIGLLMEVGQWIERLLESPAAGRMKQAVQRGDVEAGLLYGEALLSVGETSYLWGLPSKSERALIESIAIFEAIGEPALYLKAAGQMQLGTLYICTRPEQSRRYLETSRDTIIRMGERRSLPDFDRKLVALYMFTGDLQRARQFAEEDLQVCRESYDLAPAAREWLGSVAFFMGEFDQAIACYQQAQEDSWQLENFSFASYHAYMEGCVELARGNNQRVLGISEEMLARGRQTADTSWFVNADILLALLEWTQGAYDRAEQRSEEGLSKHQAKLMSFTIPYVYVLGRVALTRGDLAKAERFFRQMDEMVSTPCLKWKAYSLHAFGLLAVAQSRQDPGMAQRAAMLFGAQEKLFAWLSNILSPSEKSQYERARTMLKEILGEENFSQAWASGQAMSHNQAFALALQ